HRRWQADLDVGVTDAAAQLSSGTTYTATLQQAMSRLTQTLAQDGYPVSGPTITTTISGSDLNNGGCFTRSGITLCNPPISTPFQGLSHYVQGTISTTVPGFFGKVIGLGKMHINVQAVAKHTGSVAQNPYTILALNS